MYPIICNKPDAGLLAQHNVTVPQPSIEGHPYENAEDHPHTHPEPATVAHREDAKSVAAGRQGWACVHPHNRESDAQIYVHPYAGQFGSKGARAFRLPNLCS